MNIDQERAIFHMEVGHALNEWAELENSIRYAALTVVSTEEQRRALSLGFFAIETFRSKLAFASAMIERNLAGTVLADEWEKLAQRARDASLKRNQLAHRTVRSYPAQKLGERILLIPWRFPKPKKKANPPKPPPGSITLREIVDFRFKITALSVAILNWNARASGKKEPHPKLAEKATRAPTVDGMLRVIKLMFK